ncbi:MAG TPA: molecular chaperone TorD family protein [Noviherbaspirillum sp.]|nr:molecular chaperone TorD family protein [Noviherbaspirillum sp.]
MTATMPTTQSTDFEEPGYGEEAGRANLYGVLATLFYEPPSQALLDGIAASSGDNDSLLQQAWNQLAGACRHADAAAVRDEYEALFIGVGKPEVMLYGSYYLSGFLMEKPLATLRSELASLGLQRDERMPESEDHIAGLCEVMRHLILSDDAPSAGLDTQMRFFAGHMQPWVNEMCDAMLSHPDARFYKAVAVLAMRFFDVEKQAFDMAN